jgi:phosphoglycolate phosphatase
MKLTNKKHLIFDLDGTLIDSVPDLALALNNTMLELNRDIFCLDMIRTWVGNGSATLIKRALSGDVNIDENLSEELFNKAHKIFLEQYRLNVCEQTLMFDGVKSSLERLKNKGYTLSIVTNKPLVFVKPILDSFGIEELFSLYIGGDSLDVKKPNPKPLLYVCEKLGFNVEQSVMIGDSKNDIQAASNCSMQSIAVSYGYNYDEDISVHNPSVIIDNFEDILKIL